MCEFVHCARQPQHIRYLLRLSAKVLLGAGGLQNPVVHAKAMESRWLLLFARFALQAHRAKLRPNPAPLLACVDALYAWYSIVLNAGPVLGAPECARMLQLSKNCAVFFRASGHRLRPKFHFMVEMSRLAPWTGNPRFHSTYPDETLNGVIVRQTRWCNSHVFATGVLLKYRVLRMSQGRPY